METGRKALIARGWIRAVIYAAGISFILAGVNNYGSYIIHSVMPGTEQGDESILQFGVLYLFIGLSIFLFTWLMRKFVDRKSFTSLGFAWKGYGNEAGLGFFAALSLLGIGTLILIVPGYLAFTGARLDVGSLLIEAVIMVAVAFAEELLFRGYLLSNFMESMNKWIALVITALLFALFHISNPDITVFAIINIFLAGLLLGLNYIFTRSLWFGIFFHFAWNYYQGPVLGYSVSGLKLNDLLLQSLTGPPLWTGGAFGFEGSLLCPLLTAIAVLIFGFAFTRRYEG